MDSEQTLLSHLMPWLHSPIEDRGTDALAFILTRSEACRRELTQFLREDNFEPEPIERVRTQIAVDAKSRPDLIGFDSRGRINLIIESKFWAPLQPRQAPRYLKQLDADGPKTLLFLCPGTRIESLWKEVCAQLQSCGHTVTDKLSDDQGSVRRSDVDLPLTQVVMTGWGHLLATLAKADLDPADESDINQLRGLAKRQEDEGFVPLTDEMTKPDWQKRDAHFRRMCDEAVFFGRSSGWLNTDGLTVAKTTRRYGRYCRVDGTDTVLRLGVEYTAELFDQSPIWISSKESYYKGGADPGAIFTGADFGGPRWNRWWKPVHLMRCCVYEEVLENVINQLKVVAGEIRAIEGK